MPRSDEYCQGFITVHVASVAQHNEIDCSDFCSDPAIRWAHPDASGNILWLRLNRVFSVEGLKGNRLRWLELLPWAQEVWSSNLHAPTKSLKEIQVVGLKIRELR